MFLDLSQLQKVETQEDRDNKIKVSEAITYLNSTDWYIIRFLETGQTVPEDVSLKRSESRKLIKDLK